MDIDLRQHEAHAQAGLLGVQAFYHGAKYWYNRRARFASGLARVRQDFPYKGHQYKKTLQLMKRRRYALRRRRGIPRRMRGRYRRVGYYGRYNRRLTDRSVQQELKFHDVFPTDVIVPTTGVVHTSMVLIPQGTTQKERLGRKAIIRSIAFRLILSVPLVQGQADIPDGEVFRIILFIDKQCNGANAAVSDILITTAIEGYRNMANIGRFTILCDKHVTINRTVAMADGTNTSSSPLVYRRIKGYYKLNLPIEYSGTAGSITEIRSNNIAWLFITQSGEGGVSVGSVRVRFDG